MTMMVIEVVLMIIVMALIAAFIFDADKNMEVKTLKVNENEGFRF